MALGAVCRPDVAIPPAIQSVRLNRQSGRNPDTCARRIGIIDAPEPAAPVAGRPHRRRHGQSLDDPCRRRSPFARSAAWQQAPARPQRQGRPEQAGLLALTTSARDQTRAAMSSATNVICHGVVLSTISRAALESSRSRSAASRHSTSAAGDQFRPPQAVQAEYCAYGCP